MTTRHTCTSGSRPPTAVITSIASYLPEKILTNDDLAALVDTSDEWITTRTGIKERRIAASDEFASTMGAHAAQKVLANSGCSPDEIDLIIVSTMTPDFLCPSTAALIQKEIRATKAGAVDVSAACSGFLYGLATAKAFIESGLYRTILLIATEKNSAFIDFSDRNTCVIFGDGAGACLIRNGGPGLRVRNLCLGASGNEFDLIQIKGGGCRLPSSPTSYQDKEHVIRMNGKETFKHAVRRMEEAITECLATAGVQAADLSWLVPHQANIRIIDAVAKRFDIPKERVAITLEKMANTSSSTIPIALDILRTAGQIAPQDLLLLTAVGGGLTWGAILLEEQG